MAKFICEPKALIQKAQERQRGSKNRGRPGKREKEEREDRPNAVTPITLRLPRELRLCQVTIFSYTRWPFLNRPSAPVRTAQNRWRGSRERPPVVGPRAFGYPRSGGKRRLLPSPRRARLYSRRTPSHLCRHRDALGKRSAPLRCRRDPRWMGARGVR
jgi:hypothetical protein